MTHLEEELLSIKNAVLEMTELTKLQISKSIDALLNHDPDLATEIIHHENRVNAMELSIDRDCENALALYTPVAVDLRYILAILKVNSHIERAADHASATAKYVLDLKSPLSKELVDATRIVEMSEAAVAIIEDVYNVLDSEDTSMARAIFKKDSILNEINRASSEIIKTYSKNNPDHIEQALHLFSVIKKLERIGDLAKNIAEEIIFYIEAKVLRHKKKKSN